MGIVLGTLFLVFVVNYTRWRLYGTGPCARCLSRGDNDVNKLANQS